MPPIPSLIIPVRFNTQGVPAALNTVGTAGTAAGNAVAAGMNNAGAAAVGMGADAYGAQQIIQGMGSIATSVMQSVGQGLKEAAEYCQKLAENFAVLQDSMQEVAALTSKTNTNSFTLEQAQLAQQANLTPQAWTDFQKKMQSYGGAYLSGELSPFKESDDQTAEAQSMDFQKRVAKYAQARGGTPANSAQMAGGILQFTKGAKTPDELMKDIAQVDFVLERAATPKEQLQPQTVPLMASGSSPQEAAMMLNLFGEIHPGWEGVYARGTNEALKKRQQDKGKEQYGMKEGMSPYERMKAVAENLAARNLTDGGLDEEIAKLAHGQHHAEGIKGLVNRGAIAHGFTRVEGYLKATPADYEKQKVEEFAKSAPGGRADQAARSALKDVEIGSAGQNLLARQAEAEIGIKDELRRPESLLEQLQTKAGQAFNQGDRREQLIRAETTRMLVMDLEKSERGREWLSERGPGELTGRPGAGKERGVLLRNNPRNVNDAMLSEGANLQAQILKDIAKNTKNAVAKPPPLVPRQPPPVGRRP